MESGRNYLRLILAMRCESAGATRVKRAERYHPYPQTFVYDPLGNRLVKNADGDRTTTLYDAGNQIRYSVDAGGRTTYTFDAAGNQRIEQAPSGQRTTVTWNYENQPTLTEFPIGTRTTTVYNADNRRVSEET